MFPLYRVLAGLTVWLVLVPASLVSLALGRTSLRSLRQRLGHLGTVAERPGRVVVHAVSAGEMAAAEALLAHWPRPGSSVVLTTCSRDGLVVGEQVRGRRPEVERVMVLPWDRPGTVRNWLRTLRPELVVVVETEIWPGLFTACRELGVPLAVVNGRIAPGDAKRYRLLSGFFRRVLSSAAWIGVLDEAERQRWIEIGSAPQRVEVMGQLKYDGRIAQRPTQSKVLSRWSAMRDGADRLLVAASTHRPEEKLLLDALARLGDGEVDKPKMVLAPRHPRRARAVRRLARRRGLRSVLSSDFGGDSGPGDGWDVLILDRMGELPSVLDHATVVVLGGTFAPVGGHNVIEAAARGKAVVTGPHTSLIAETIEELTRQQAVIRLESGRQLFACLEELLADEGARRRLGERALAATRACRGVAAAYGERLDSLVSSNRSRIVRDHA
jgi:3-deoxy-D-manno-octulosonic-acid transferase